MTCLLKPAGGLTSNTSSTPSSKPTATLQQQESKPHTNYTKHATGYPNINMIHMQLLRG